MVKDIYFCSYNKYTVYIPDSNGAEYERKICQAETKIDCVDTVISKISNGK